MLDAGDAAKAEYTAKSEFHQRLRKAWLEVFCEGWTEPESVKIHARDPHNADAAVITYVDLKTDPEELLKRIAMLQAAFDRLWEAYVDVAGEPSVEN
jgi:hypothetical protein